MTTSGSKDIETTSAHTALDGYSYQLKVSVLFALDLLANKQLTDQIILEPASEEDIEAKLPESDDEPSILTQGISINTKQLVVQCKLRGTGPWKHGNLTKLLKHGKRRKSAEERLKDPNINYLLVTSADLDGVARNLAVSSPTQWDHLKKVQPTMPKELSDIADGRVAVWSCLDKEKIESRIRTGLTDWFRVPTSKLEDCIARLEAGALARMRGVGSGIWTRENVIQIIEEYDGYHGISKDLLTFVPPTNWQELNEHLESKNAIVITGPSGTGKTTMAKALIATVRDANRHTTRIKISGGPEQIHNDTTKGSVIYEIEDPWGKYRAGRSASPWNNEINTFLNSASADRKFVVTSRSDIMEAADLKTLDRRYTAELTGEHYRKTDRNTLFENRLKALQRGVQPSALKYKDTVIKDLLLPLEIERFFGGANLGAKEGEAEITFMHRCINEAKQQFIETSLVSGIKDRGDWEPAAIIWVLMKALKCVTSPTLDELEVELYGKLPDLEDKLIPFVDFLIAGHNLKKNETEISCTHPRVEAGLEAAALQNANKTSRVIKFLIEALIGLDQATGTNWGTETAVHVYAATSHTDKLNIRIPTAAQNRIDIWLASRLSSNETTLQHDLDLAIKTGSEKCAVAELARWLDGGRIGRKWYQMMYWTVPAQPEVWYDWISTEPHTNTICATFIESVLGHMHESFPDDFFQSVTKLSPSHDFTPSFRAGLGRIIDHGYGSNTQALINGAIVDLEGFELLLLKAADVCDELNPSHDRQFQLSIENDDYDYCTAEHYLENGAEEGYTASKVLESYVEAHSKAGEWQKLAAHPRCDSFIWEWIKSVEKNNEVEESELELLGEVAFNHRHEDQFWDVAKTNFTDSLTDLLKKRLKEGSANRKIRVSATKTALTHATSLINDLFSGSAQLATERTLELAMDICVALQSDEKPITEQHSIISKYTTGLPEDVATAILLVLNFPEVKASSASTKVLESVSESTRLELNVAIAKILSRCGKNVSDRINHILKTEYVVSTDNIELVNQAMELGVSLGQELINVGLMHEFALCRVTTMNAIFSSRPAPLPSTLLDMRRDTSSLVRKRLVNMLEEKPHNDHTDALIDLSYDRWTPDDHSHGDAVGYPIAEKAAKLLLTQTNLSEDDLKCVVQSLNKSDNYNVKLTLLRSLVKHGSTSRRDNIAKLAIGEGKPVHQRLSAQALYCESDILENSQLEIFTAGDVATVSPETACWLILAVTARSSDTRIVDFAKHLAITPDRSVIIALIYIVTFGQENKDLHKEISTLLAADKISALNETLKSRDASKLEYLDELGEVRMVEKVKYFFKLYFK